MRQKVSEPDNVRYTYFDRMLRKRHICDLPYDTPAEQRHQVTSCTLNMHHNALLRRVSQSERDHQEALRGRTERNLSTEKNNSCIVFLSSCSQLGFWLV